MFCISVQIRPKAAADFAQDAFIAQVRDIRSPEIDDYEEKGKRLLSFNFFTEFPAALWSQLQPLVTSDTALGQMLRENTLIVCEDEESTAAYLLHHFDSRETLDSLPQDAV